MFDNFFDKLFAPAISGVAILGGALISTGIPQLEDGSWITSAFEKGGVAIVLLILFILSIRYVAPPILNWMTNYLNELEKRNTDTQKRWEDRMDRAQDKYLQDMKEERDMKREMTNSFREMLHSHKAETVAAIKEQSALVKKQVEYTEALVEELSNRPCQAPTLANRIVENKRHKDSSSE
jgi:F0F1-type ATP synthase membrane subunit b/b'